MENVIQVGCDLILVAAGTPETLYVPIAAAGTWKMRKAYFTPFTNRTADDTNYTTMTVKKGSTAIATEATTTADTGDLVAGTAIALALTGSGQDLEFAQGSSIVVTKTESGTGLALDGSFQFELVQVRA
jgi:hypothetical protein